MTMSDLLFEAIGLALLHLLWQGALVAGLLAAALRILATRSAVSRYSVACLALAGLVALGVTTAIRSYDGAQSLAAAPAQTAVTSFSALSQPAEIPAMLRAATLIRIYAPEIVMVWLAGVTLLTIRLGVSWFRARRLVTRSGKETSSEWQKVVQRLSTSLRLSRPVRLIESAAVEVPAVVGWLRPAILLPASSLTGLTPEQLEMILAHELAHISRHDFLVNIAQSIAETLLFYHPATWWISRQIRIERENCCDDRAVAICGNPLQYARALTVLEELRQAPSMAVAASGGSLFARIGRLLGRSERGHMTSGWSAVAAAVTFVVLITVASLPALADRSVAPEEPAIPAKPAEPAEPPEPPNPPKIAEEAPAPKPAPLPRRAGAIPETPIAPVAVATPRVAVAIAPKAWPSFAGVELNAWDADDQDQSSEDGTFDPSRKLTVDELISLRIHNVTPEYLDEMKRTGLPDLKLQDLLAMRIHGVTPKYIADLRAAGVEIKTAEEATSLMIFNVTPQFVRSLSEAGYTKLTARELIRLSSTGVNADFIRDLSRYRDKK